jgi:hypothetical protein
VLFVFWAKPPAYGITLSVTTFASHFFQRSLVLGLAAVGCKSITPPLHSGPAPEYEESIATPATVLPMQTRETSPAEIREIANVSATLQPAFGRCYQKELRTEAPEPKTKVFLRFSVLADGSTSEPVVSGSVSEEMKRCLLATLRDARFAVRASAAAAPVVLPVEFVRDSDGGAP